MEGHGVGVLVDLVLGDTLNVDAHLLPVYLNDLSLTVRKSATDDTYFVILADGKRAHVVLLAEALLKGSAHELSPLARRSIEVSLPVLSAG
mmetsp:Transcript_35835/g.93408  ORF Transcript_35835/g.93408 Transcript_35835/m.93408 type:complete len:91 (-) Transcript_35835:92-364(-)